MSAAEFGETLDAPISTLTPGVPSYFINAFEFFETIDGLCAPSAVGSQLSQARDTSKNVVQRDNCGYTGSHHLLEITGGPLDD